MGKAIADPLFLVEKSVGFISPLLGQGWALTAKAESQDPLWQEMETMLLLEQSGLSSMPQQNTDQDPGAQETADSTLWFPEDGEEVPGDRMEWDGDLLAEIDRENEAMRQQAELLLQNQQEGMLTDSPARLPLPYTMEQLNDRDFLVKDIYYVNKTTRIRDGLLDASAMLVQDMKFQNPNSGGAKVLIHHTHATEYFADSDAKNEETLIVGVGDYLEEILENRYGIEVIHDRTVYPYNEAYSRALKHVGQILAENPTIEVFIDLHRDAGGTKKYTLHVEGKETANLMFFNGLSHNVNGPIDYLPNENLEANLAFSFQMKMAGDSLYPGLCKRNYLKAYRYNLHVLPRSVIVEVGDNNNTLQEAKNAMEPLARILNYVLTGEY